MAKGKHAGAGESTDDGADGKDPPKAQTIRLPTSLWRALKHRAVDEERPMSEIIRDAVNQYLQKPRRGDR
jgi:hypothetical protein